MDKRASFTEQSIALFKINILLKQRNLGQLFTQIVIPLIFVGLIWISFMPLLSLKDKDEIPQPVSGGKNWVEMVNSMFKTWIISPQNNFTESIKRELEGVLNKMGIISIITINNTFKNSDQIKDYYIKNPKVFKFAIIFDEISNSRISYTIKMPFSKVPDHRTLMGDMRNCRKNPFTLDENIGSKETCNEMIFYTKGFTSIQTVIDSTIIRVISTNENISDAIIPMAKLSVYPKPKAKSDIKLVLLALSVSIIFVFATQMPLLTANLVKQKEKKIKEVMFMMSLRISVYWFTWFTTEAIIFTFLSLIYAIVISVSKIIPNTNFIVLFIILFLLIFLFSLTILEISAILTTFFSKEMTSTQVISIFCLAFPAFPLVIIMFNIPVIYHYFLALFSPNALTLGIKSILTITYLNDSSLNLSNLFSGPGVSIGVAILILLLDNLLYILLALYLDQVIPGQYGAKQNCCFCLSPNYWFNQRSIHPKTGDVLEQNADIEEVSKDVKQNAVIVISKITKQFTSSTNGVQKTTNVVDNISMAIYKSEITALLGHNGAGKTTLINMLIGAIPPTSGTAFIYGRDITNGSQMNDLRAMFGICLQENVLFDDFNSEEHLLFFGQIKGIESNKLKNEVNQLLIDVQLVEHRFTHSKFLSGGQQRKLCIAIALIGSPKVVILDEPTSGVDPSFRRQIWSIIQKHKKDKTVIMTTHFMEEADILSDRKAIISKGKLRCYGSSLFLKQRFGIGYHLVIDVDKEANIDEITSLVKSQVSSSVFERFTGTEVYYILPLNESKNFSKLCEVLEKSVSDKSHIKSFGISMTTLEEVFLKIAEEEEENSLTNNKKKSHHSNSIIANNSQSNLKFEPNFIQTFLAYFKIKLLLLKRNPWPLIQINISIISIFLVLFVVIHILGTDSAPKSTIINPNIYDKSVSNLKYQNKSTEDLTEFDNIVTEFGVKPQLIDNINFQTLNGSYMAVIINSFRTRQWEWLFNETYIYSLPILQNLMANVYLRSIDNSEQRTIQTASHPFELIAQEDDKYYQMAQFQVYYLSIVYLVMLTVVIALPFGFEIIDDRETKIIQTIRISGMSFMCYWLTNLTIHSIILLFEVILIIVLSSTLIRLQQIQTLETLTYFSIHLFLSTVLMLLMIYVLGYLYATKANASSTLTLIIILPTFVIFIFIVVLFIIVKLTIFCIILSIIVSIIWPPFAALAGQTLILIIGMNIIDLQMDARLLLYLLFLSMICSLHFYLFLLKLFDTVSTGGNVLEELGLQSRNTMNFPTVMNYQFEDEDVIKERMNVNNTVKTKQNIPILLVHVLRKEFSNRGFLGLGGNGKPELAVFNLSFMVEKNNIFGLLGPNGAGKTTTMKIIIRQETQSSGLVWIDGQIVDSSKLHLMVGYCPQHDTLWKDITLKEHLYLFAAIHGVKNKDMKNICSKYMNDLKIDKHADKRTEHLSGGTKRKLCFILSIFGQTKLVLLDEPSTGMDPQAKRFLWTTIQSLFNANSNKSAVLTTHSMEEASALCTRIAIMTKGMMRCIGSVQHLKDRYGAGYLLEIKWNEKLNSNSVKELVSKIFTEWTVKQEYDNRITFAIPQHSVTSLSRIFSSLEELKNSKTGIEEYNFSQTTLEQVFIHFAKEHEYQMGYSSTPHHNYNKQINNK